MPQICLPMFSSAFISLWQNNVFLATVEPIFFQIGLFVFVKEFSPKNDRHKTAIKWVCNDGNDVSRVYP